MLDTYTSIYTAVKYHYTYWITNTKLHKHYIGVRTSKIPPIHDLGIKYFSSSSDKQFKKDQKINPQDYEYKIIGVFTTYKEASLNEIELHETYNVGRNPRFYNRAKATSIGFNTSGTKHTEESKKKIGNASKNRPIASLETRMKISDANKGVKSPPVSEKTRMKMKDAWKTRPPMTDETRKKKIEAGKNRLPDSDEIRKKKSKAAKLRWQV
jgi:hypothetical protein